jgi:hypothetical protein
MTDFTYLSLGAGVQSSALLVMSAKGLYDCPRADIAVFADTGDEPQWVYDNLERLSAWSPIPVHITSKGCLSEWVLDRKRQGKAFVNVPLYTASPTGDREGMLRRQCTREFKITPIEQFIRQFLGYGPGQRVKEKVVALHGISIDEATRMKPSRTPWVTVRFPLVDAELDRRACERVLREHGFEVPRKSACVYCPYRSDGEWQDWKLHFPDEFARAVAFDYAVRDMTMRGKAAPAYVHKTCQPLDEVDFDPLRDQIDMFGNECEGMCGL